jgi:hypothetical protein
MSFISGRQGDGPDARQRAIQGALPPGWLGRSDGPASDRLRLNDGAEVFESERSIVFA